MGASSRKSMMDDPMQRRAVSLSVVFIGFPVALAVSPLVIVVAVAVDLVVAPRRCPTTRLAVLVYGYWALAVWAQVRIGLVWLRSGCGRWNHSEVTQRRYMYLTSWWTRRVVALLGPTIGFRLEVEGGEELADGASIMLPRHLSVLDAFLGPALVTSVPGRSIRVVMARELRLEPNLDVVGHRTPHHFVDRSGGDPAGEIARVGALGVDLPESATVILFPEGRLFRPDLLRRELRRLERREPERTAVLRELTHVLPPRPGGVVELLRTTPGDTDILFVAHVGFEQIASPPIAWRSIPMADPVAVRIWRVDRSEVPPEPRAQVAWLDQQWLRVNRWVAEHGRA